MWDVFANQSDFDSFETHSLLSLDKSQRKGDRYHVITGDALYFMEEHSTMAPVCNISLHKFISQLFFF